MSDPRFIQSGFDKALAHLVEECGEVLAAAGKTQRWGRESVNPLLTEGDPLYGERNIVWLMREVKDLEEVIQRLRTEVARIYIGAYDEMGFSHERF